MGYGPWDEYFYLSFSLSLSFSLLVCAFVCIFVMFETLRFREALLPALLIRVPCHVHLSFKWFFGLPILLVFGGFMCVCSTLNCRPVLWFTESGRFRSGWPGYDIDTSMINLKGSSWGWCVPERKRSLLHFILDYTTYSWSWGRLQHAKPHLLFCAKPFEGRALHFHSY